ncbi:MAG: hypothetical protein AAF191_02880 [Verrucomicrobiota bacterium]
MFFRFPISIAVVSLLAFAQSAVSEDATALWNQEKAKAKVQHVLDLEEQGLLWDAIPWIADPALAASKAARLDKPIFIFLYLKTEIGPPEAPC